MLFLLARRIHACLNMNVCFALVLEGVKVLGSSGRASALTQHRGVRLSAYLYSCRENLSVRVRDR